MHDLAPDLALPLDATRLEPLRTERMTLRPLVVDDSADVWEYQRLPEVLRYIPWPERTREEGYEHTAKRAGLTRLDDDGDGVFFAMALRGEPTTRESSDGAADGTDGSSADDRVVGDVMLRIASAQHAGLEIGWVLHPAFQGRGLALEAAREVMRFAFERLRAHRVHATLDARNAASARLCERLGMRREATLVDEEFHDGAWETTAVYAVLRREWAAR